MTAPSMSQPHDALFRDTFSDPVHAAGQLRSVLPAAFVAQCDWSTLALEPASFVDDELRATQSDLLYRVQLRGAGEALVYVLLEHQSRTDPLMAYRLLAYMLRIWERWLREHSAATRLPMIVPLVVHHGRSAWSAPVTFESLVEIPDGSLAKHVPSFSFVLDDLTAQHDAVIVARLASMLGRLVLLALKHARSPEADATVIARVFGQIGAVVSEPDARSGLMRVLRYLRDVRGESVEKELRAMLTRTRTAELDPIFALIPDNERWIEPLINGLADQLADLKQEFREEARREAREEVREEVREAAAHAAREAEARTLLTAIRAALLTVLGARFSALPDDVTARVNTATTDECTRWLARSAVVPTLADVFETG